MRALGNAKGEWLSEAATTVSIKGTECEVYKSYGRGAQAVCATIAVTQKYVVMIDCLGPVVSVLRKSDGQLHTTIVMESVYGAPTCVVEGPNSDDVVFGTTSGKVVCVDAETEERLWNSDGDASPIAEMLTVGHSFVVARSSRGQLRLCKCGAATVAARYIGYSTEEMSSACMYRDQIVIGFSGGSIVAWRM
ncbi:MAG: hypothetical protein JSS49_13780 [Planctomycetes bacterium]|nr:hypothetical protein [Planctomycetota bacterium]